MPDTPDESYVLTPDGPIILSRVDVLDRIGYYAHSMPPATLKNISATFDFWHYRRKAVEEERDRLREALMYHVEDEDGPCRLDHHGYCQDHSSFEEGECMIRRHRRLLGLELNNG